MYIIPYNGLSYMYQLIIHLSEIPEKEQKTKTSKTDFVEQNLALKNPGMNNSPQEKSCKT